MPESEIAQETLRREFMDNKKFRIFQLSCELPAGILSLRRKKLCSYEAVDITAKEGGEQKSHTLSQLAILYPKTAVYVYGKEGVARLENTGGSIRVDILRRGTERGEQVLVDGFVWGKDVAFRLGDSMRLDYSYTVPRPGALHAPGIMGIEPDLEVRHDFFSFRTVDGIVIQNNTLVGSVGWSTDMGQLPGHSKFYQPVRKK